MSDYKKIHPPGDLQHHIQFSLLICQTGPKTCDGFCITDLLGVHVRLQHGRESHRLHLAIFTGNNHSAASEM